MHTYTCDQIERDRRVLLLFGNDFVENKPTTRNKRGETEGEETTTNEVEHWTDVGEEQGALRVIFDRVKIRRGAGRVGTSSVLSGQLTAREFIAVDTLFFALILQRSR